MAAPNNYRAFSHHEDPTTAGPCSYAPLKDGDQSIGDPAWRRKPKKKLFMIIPAGLLMAWCLMAFLGENGSDCNVEGDVSLNSLLGSTRRSTLPSALKSVSRGVSAGVSEKTNRQFSGMKASSDPWSDCVVKPTSFPWSNSMLSWQRTSFHFQPEKNWMNDPNGPMFYKGWYHFFYQYNPHGVVWGDIVWGHAISRDLIHWLHLPLAMVADQWYDINGVWTGSATLLPDGQIIMLYTGSTNGSVQVQNLAYPSDLSDPLLLNWVKYSGNPVLVPPPSVGIKDFRDPTTAWFTPDGKWRITIGSKVNKTGVALVYETEDFKNYELIDGVLHGVQRTGMWECVDFYPVSKTAENGLDLSAYGPGVKHVLKASRDEDRNDYYAIGTYDHNTTTWTPDDPRIDVGIGLRYDYGKFYASKTFYDPNKKRRVLWGWIPEADSEPADVKRGWASLQNIPRTVSLDKKTGSNLLQWPVEEIESLRMSRKDFDKLEVPAGSVVPLDVGEATQLDIIVEFEIDKEALMRTTRADMEYSCSTSGGAAERGALGPFGLMVLADEKLSEQTPVYFYIAKGIDGNLTTFFCSDQSRSSEASDVNKKIFGSTVSVLQGEKLTMRILVDHSIIESFAQGGRTCITSRVYPTKAIFGSSRIFLFNNATSTKTTTSLKIWHMNSAFIRPYFTVEKS